MSHTNSHRPSVKTALVLAGGGLTGAVYEIGALRAIDDLLVDLDTSQFDIYVGTSAGALVSAFLANGLTPAELMRALDNDHPYLRGPRARELMGLNVREVASRVVNLPFTATGIAGYYLRNWRDCRPLDALSSLSETLPSALATNDRLATYVYRTLMAAGGADDFRKLDRELYIIATDLDTGQRAVFGEGDLADVPISQAVAASSAIPLLYRPVRIKDRDYVDGVVRGTASLDVAVEHGAQVVVVVNSAVPLDNSRHTGIPFFGRRAAHLSDKGIAAVAAQVYRTWFHSGLVYHIKQIQRRHPDVTIILIEPPATDSSMFFLNNMRYSARMSIAQHGYESVTVNLARDYHKFRDMLARYGITITPKQVNRELELMRQRQNDPDTVRAIMENVTDLGALASVSQHNGATDHPDTESYSLRELSSASERLDRALQDLERVLTQRSQSANGTKRAAKN